MRRCLRNPRCTAISIASLFLIAGAAACLPTRSLTYTVQTIERSPTQLAITATIRGVAGASLDLRGYAPLSVMQLSGLDARAQNGRPLKISQQRDTTRVKGRLVDMPLYRVEGPLPSTVIVRYRVTPGRREGDDHLGYSGKCFGYLGPSFGVATGRQLFLLPQPAESAGRIRVRFALPRGWAAVTPWRRNGNEWTVGLPRSLPAEHLISAVIGIGDFAERAFALGRTRVRLAFAPGIADQDRSLVAQELERTVRFVRGVMGRDLGKGYLVLVAPETPGGDEIMGEGWASGQGATLVPLTAARLRGVASQILQAYVRYPPYRTEIRRPEEQWLVDAIANWYAMRAVASAGLADALEMNRALGVSYLTAVTTEGVDRNLERLYADGGPGEQVARDVLAPFALFHLDHELRTKGRARSGADGYVRRMFAGRTAPSLWALLPGAESRDWASFRSNYVRGIAYAPVPDLFQETPTRPVPTPAGGQPVQTLTVAYTGNGYGYIENCGCKVNQSGGIARRATVLDSLRAADPELVLLDAGSSFVRPEAFEAPDFLQDREQRFYLKMMDRMRYGAAAVGLTELTRGIDYFREMRRGLATPYLAANVSANGVPVGPASIVLRTHGKRIAVIGILEPPRGGGAMRGFDRSAARLTFSDFLSSLQRESSVLRGRADVVIALGRLTPSTIRTVARTCPSVDVIVSTDYEVPRWAGPKGRERRIIRDKEAPGFIGRTLVLYTSMGQYGLSSARIGIDRDGRTAAAAVTDHWLDETVPDQPALRNRLNRFYDGVGRLEMAQAAVRAPLAGDPYWQHGRYVGAAACASCHAQEYAQWKETGHAGAYKTLLDRHRHYQPKCISCHVVGFGSESGYKLGQAEEPLGNVQCEVCHGPGAEHREDPSTANIRREVPESVCLECHNPEHSDHFVYATRLPRVMHRGSPGLSMR